jgi:3-oxoacyl-(acyl-carrier-protein) synthase
MAGITPSEVDLVAASANGDSTGDAMEASVLAELMPDASVAAYKERSGECYGASPLLSAVCALADMKAGRVNGVSADYPTIPGVNLEKGTLERSISHALVNAFSCDGNCGAVVLRNRP